MNPLAWSALALATMSDPSSVKAGDVLASVSDGGDETWSALDRDVESLAAAVAQATSPMGISAWMKVAFRANSDEFVDLDGDNVEDPGENDLRGIQFQGLRVNFSGTVGPFDIKLGAEGASGGDVGNMSTRDAYARAALGSHLHVQAGNFRAPFLFSGVASDEKEIFFDRTTQGSLWSVREPGVMLDGVHGRFTWWASALNGGDRAGDEWLLIGKAAFAFAGEPVLPKQTGGYGVDSPTRFQVGLGFADDSSAKIGDATATSIEGVLISGPVFALAEFLDYDDGFVPNSIPTGQAARAAAADVADTAPWSATIGVMVSEVDKIALRVEDVDDSADTRNFGLGYSRYMAGHAAKLQLNWVRTDDNADETDELIIGLVASI